EPDEKGSHRLLPDLASQEAELEEGHLRLLDAKVLQSKCTEDQLRKLLPPLRAKYVSPLEPSRAGQRKRCIELTKKRPPVGPLATSNQSSRALLQPLAGLRRLRSQTAPCARDRLG
ncbi:unnamed protein product, partial [Durusdinium trenchii]